MDERPYTVARLAERWEVSDTFIYSEIKRGNLRAMRYGAKLIRIPAAAVYEYEGDAAAVSTVTP